MTNTKKEMVAMGYHQVKRARFYQECRKLIEHVNTRGLQYRAKRMAERAVIFETLERYGLVKRYRGGSQATAKAEIFS